MSEAAAPASSGEISLICKFAKFLIGFSKSSPLAPDISVALPTNVLSSQRSSRVSPVRMSISRAKFKNSLDSIIPLRY